MNHDQFKKCVGQTLRLEPPAIGPDGRPTDDDWEVVGVDDARKAATLRNRTRGGAIIVGFDHVKSYDSDPARGDKFGFLNMLWQLRIGRDGAITARPIPVRPAAAARPEFHPLIVNDGDAERHLTWADRDSAVALLPEGEARQLFGTFVGVCAALRTETNREPQFDAAADVRHEIVWELADDHLSKHKLLGGMGGKAATAVLVLTNNKAQQPQEPIVNTSAGSVGTFFRAAILGGRWGTDGKISAEVKFWNYSATVPIFFDGFVLESWPETAANDRVSHQVENVQPVHVGPSADSSTRVAGKLLKQVGRSLVVLRGVVHTYEGRDAPFQTDPMPWD